MRRLELVSDAASCETQPSGRGIREGEINIDRRDSLLRKERKEDEIESERMGK